MKKWILIAIGGVVATYALLFGTVLVAMMQPPEVFGQFMSRVPPALVWGALPAPRMWLWARSGTLEAGDEAPDFTLPTVDHSAEVTLSSFRGDRPVVLVFGSYT